MKIHETITRETWTKRAMARDIIGVPISFNEPEAVSWCLLGWLARFRVTLEERRVVDEAIQALFPERFGQDGVPTFNDHTDTTFEDVLQVLKAVDV